MLSLSLGGDRSPSTNLQTTQSPNSPQLNLSKILPPNSLSAQFVSNFQSFASELNKTRNQLFFMVFLYKFCSQTQKM